jgi:type IV secretion system protein VirB9
MLKGFAFCLLASVPVIGMAQDDYSDLFPTGTSTPEPVISNMYYSPNPSLSPQEKAGLDISNRWRSSNSSALKPLDGTGGVVTFVFGASQPSVVCAVMQVCDIELQKGEVVTSANAGDNARWEVKPIVAGSGNNVVWHIAVKPLDVGLDTSLLVTTDRRTYHVTLRSHRDQYMARVAFTYPDDNSAQWDAYRKRVAARKAAAADRSMDGYSADSSNPEYLGDLDFEYRIDGDARWKPVRVFNDGRKTIIQMPKAMEQTEAPALTLLRGKDSFWPWGSEEEKVMTNYRIQGLRIIVDTVFDKAELVAGVGKSQDKVTIQRTAK